MPEVPEESAKGTAGIAPSLKLPRGELAASAGSAAATAVAAWVGTITGTATANGTASEPRWLESTPLETGRASTIDLLEPGVAAVQGHICCSVFADI